MATLHFYDPLAVRASPRLRVCGSAILKVRSHQRREGNNRQADKRNGSPTSQRRHCICKLRNADASAGGSVSVSPTGMLLQITATAAIATVSSVVGDVGPAAAAVDDVVKYDSSAGFGNLKVVFGVGYALLVGVFAIRLLSRRAKRAKSERLAKSEDPGSSEELGAQPQRWSDALLPPDATPAQEENATPLSALYGAAQAAFLCAVLWTFTTQVSAYFDTRLLPSNELAAKVTGTVKTIAEGLAYLLTFIFGANAVGLVALSIQLAINPGSVSSASQAKEVDPKALPKINITDDIYSIRKAFEEVQRQSEKSGR